MFDKLTGNIIYMHNTHLTTGFIGAKYLLPALTRYGRADLAYELATRKTYPSWGFMVTRGATTLWEIWQDKTGPSMNSHDHIMLGSLGSWFYRALGGIHLGKNGVGFRHILIAPHVVEDLHWVSASIETVRGLVSCSWRHQSGTTSIDIRVPVNSDARVIVPEEPDMTRITVREGKHIVWSKGKFVAGDPGVTSATAAVGAIVFRVGSGQYQFALTGR